MYAQFSRHKILVHLEQLYELGFKSFPALRTHELVEVFFLKRYGFWYLFISNAVAKVGR